MTYHQLTQEERYLISAHRIVGASRREIARRLNRATSTISRELIRNATRYDGRYRPSKAQHYTQGRRRRCRRGPRFSEQVHCRIEAALRKRWSPEQIVGCFRAQGLIVPSHETIYRRLRHDKRQGGTLYRHTRIMSKVGRKRYRSRPARGFWASRISLLGRQKSTIAESKGIGRAIPSWGVVPPTAW